MSSAQRVLVAIGLLAAFGAGIALDRLVLVQTGTGQTLESISDGDLHDHQHATWVCPMHAEIIAGEPGSCPICGMDLVQVANDTLESGREDGGPVVRLAPGVMHNFAIRSEPFERAPMARIVAAAGFIRAVKPGQKVNVKVADAAVVTAVSVRAGRLVKKGDVLLVVDMPAFEQLQKDYLAAVAKEAEPRLATEDDAAPAIAAEAEDGGKDQPADAKMEEKITASVAVPDSASLRRRLAAFGWTDEKFAVLEAGGATSPRYEIRAPIDGQLLKLAVQPGDSVEPGQELAQVTTDAEATVLADLFQRDSTWIRARDRVQVFLPHSPTQPWEGFIDKPRMHANPTSRSVTVQAAFRVPQPLVHNGMYVKIKVYGDPIPDVPTVPREALIRTENETRVVIALGDGRFQAVPVQAGLESGGRVHIRSGLKEGDEVVVSGQFLIDSESSLRASFLRLGSAAQESDAPADVPSSP